MKLASKWRTKAAVSVFLAGVATARAQQPAPPKPLMAEQVFRNVRVLKGIPVGEFMDTMGFFASSLGLNCVYCHTEQSMENWANFADDVPRKQTARAMILMVNALNKGTFAGKRALTCYTCHRGSQIPKTLPSLAEQYGLPVEDPNEVEIVPNAPPGPTADQILDKYIQAIGGAQRAAALTSFTAKGTYDGYETYHLKEPLEIYAKAPAQRTMIAHTQNGDSAYVFDGREGWVAAADKPVGLLPLMPGSEIDGARIDAALSFPGRIKEALTQWRAGFPVATIDDKEVTVIQGLGAGGSRIKLYFDSESGLLLRQVRYKDTIVGTIPQQIDYSNYKDVAGVKMPFRWTVTWTDGQSNIDLTEVQPNATVEAAKFAQPAPAVLKRAGK